MGTDSMTIAEYEQRARELEGFIDEHRTLPGAPGALWRAVNETAGKDPDDRAAVQAARRHVEEVALGLEPKTTDYCVKCGESPESGSHLPHGHGHEYSPRKSRSPDSMVAGREHRAENTDPAPDASIYWASARANPDVLWRGGVIAGPVIANPGAAGADPDADGERLVAERGRKVPSTIIDYRLSAAAARCMMNHRGPLAAALGAGKQLAPPQSWGDLDAEKRALLEGVRDSAASPAFRAVAAVALGSSSTINHDPNRSEVLAAREIMLGPPPPLPEPPSVLCRVTIVVGVTPDINVAIRDAVGRASATWHSIGFVDGGHASVLVHGLRVDKAMAVAIALSAMAGRPFTCVTSEEELADGITHIDIGEI